MESKGDGLEGQPEEQPRRPVKVNPLEQLETEPIEGLDRCDVHRIGDGLEPGQTGGLGVRDGSERSLRREAAAPSVAGEAEAKVRSGPSGRSCTPQTPRNSAALFSTTHTPTGERDHCS